jgi:hypothetical protein
MAMTKKKGPVASGPKAGAEKKKIAGGKKKTKNGVSW